MNEEVTARVHENEPEEGRVRNECWAVWVVRLSKFFGCLGISISAGVQVVLVFHVVWVLRLISRMCRFGF